MHPEVYIIILPGFGIVSQVLELLTKQVISGYLGMVYAIINIAFLGFLVWVHHMYTVGLDIDTRIYFSIATAVIGIPTGVKIFSWLAMLWKNKFMEFNSLFFFIVGFLILFIVGGFTGIILSNGLLNVVLHDTYYVVAHFHYGAPYLLY